MHLALLPFDDGEFQGTVGVIREITQQKRREQRLKVLNRVLRHNLRNAVNVIIGRTEQLETSVDDRHLPAVRAIRNRGEELAGLSQKARQINHIDNYRDEKKGEALDIVDQTESIVATFREEHPKVAFTLEAPTRARAFIKHEELFVIAVRNIIENAMEHNDAAQPCVSVVINKKSESTQVRIEDNGPGVPQIEQEVFQSETESPLQHSQGIGLWLAYWSATACDGDIDIDSSVSEGAAITLEFPSAT